MKLAAKQVELSSCPYVSDESKKQLAESAAPPIRLVTLSADGQEVKVGNETVMFRHEKTFYNKPGIFIRVKASNWEKGCRGGGLGVDLELLEHCVPKRTLRQHSFDRLLQHPPRVLGVQFREADFANATGIAGMAVVFLVFGLVAGDADFRGVDNDDVVAGIDVRSVLGLVLATQTRRDLSRETAEHLALSIYHIPVVIDCARLRRIGFHGAADREKTAILLGRARRRQSFAPKAQKKRDSCESRLNPPKEEGGGDKLARLRRRVEPRDRTNRSVENAALQNQKYNGLISYLNM